MDICLLNNQEPTHLNVSTGETSIIDLILASNTLTPDMELLTLDDTHDSDHYPLILYSHNNNTPGYTKTARYNLKKADWSLNNNLIKLDRETANINNDVQHFNQSMKDAADQAIPKCKARLKRTVPWWNNEIANAFQQRKSAIRIFIRTKTLPSSIEYKRLRAKAKYIIKTAKKASWEQYVSSINTSTPTREVWQ